MQIDIRGSCSKGNMILRRDIEQRVSSALARFAPYILHVTVCLEDAGHLRPGGATHCHLAAAVTGSGHVTADVIDFRVMTAIDRALDHITHVLVHDFGRPTAPAVAMPMPMPLRLASSAVFHRRPRHL
jgi:hypothetical protein